MRKINIQKPSISNEQIKKELEVFYQNPIAQVSSQLLATIGLVVFFAVFAIRPTILTMSQLSKDIEEKKKINQQLTQKAAALSTLSTEYLKIRNDLPVLDSTIPNTPDFVNIVKRLEKLATENNVAFSSIQIQHIPENNIKEKADSEISSYTLTFTANGTYIQLKQFFDSLGEMDRFVSLDNVAFITSEKEEGILLNGTITVYYFGAPQITNGGK